MNKKPIIIICLCLLPCLLGAEQDELFATRGTGGLGASFINTPVNPYGISTAGILTIFGDTSDVIFWNPAGLAQINSSQIEFSGGVLNYDKLVSSISFATPFGEDKEKAIGFTLLNHYVGKIDSYTETDVYTKELEYMGNALIVTYAKPVSILRFGVNFKVLSEIMDKARSYGGSLDFGFIITPPLPVFLGISIENLPGFIKWDHDSDVHRIGTGYRIGLGYKDMMDRVKIGLVFSKEYGQEEMNVNLGGEFSILSILSLRLGYYNTDFTGGLGLKLGFIHISYAFYNERFLELDTVSNLVSLTIHF